MIDTPNLSDLSLKSLKAAAMVARHKNITHAASAVNRSQTAISKAILGLEKKLGFEIFNRSTNGVSPTTKGQVLISRIEEALEHYATAADAYRDMVKSDSSVSNNPVFTMSVSYSRLASLISVSENLGVKQASRRTGATPASIYNTINFLERILNTTLFERTITGCKPTPYCVVLTKHCKLAFRALEAALLDVASGDGNVRGTVTLCAFPSVRRYLIPQVCVDVNRHHPDIRIVLKDGYYHDVEAQLRSGDIDLIIGAFYDSIEHPIPNELTQKLLFDAPVHIIARVGHPIFKLDIISLEDMKQLSWVLSASGSTARKWQNKRLAENGLSDLNCQIEAYTYSMLTEIVINSNSVGLAYRHQLKQDEEYKHIRSLPFYLGEHVPIGITMRSKSTFSKPVVIFYDALKQHAKELY